MSMTAAESRKQRLDLSRNMSQPSSSPSTSTSSSSSSSSTDALAPSTTSKSMPPPSRLPKKSQQQQQQQQKQLPLPPPSPKQQPHLHQNTPHLNSHQSVISPTSVTKKASIAADLPGLAQQPIYQLIDPSTVFDMRYGKLKPPSSSSSDAVGVRVRHGRCSLCGGLGGYDDNVYNDDKNLEIQTRRKHQESSNNNDSLPVDNEAVVDSPNTQPQQLKSLLPMPSWAHQASKSLFACTADGCQGLFHATCYAKACRERCQTKKTSPSSSSSSSTSSSSSSSSSLHTISCGAEIETDSDCACCPMCKIRKRQNEVSSSEFGKCLCLHSKSLSLALKTEKSLLIAK
jgi:hypothetical protein